MLAHPHLDFNGDGIHEDLGSYSPTVSLSSFWTSGAMVSTAGDLARFGRALFDGSLLDAASLDAMRSFQSVDIGGSHFDYGLGLMRFDILGREHWAHSGGLFGEYGWFSYCPSTGVALGVTYNYPNVKATGPSLPGELLIALASLNTDGVGMGTGGVPQQVSPVGLPWIPFLSSLRAASGPGDDEGCRLAPPWAKQGDEASRNLDPAYFAPLFGAAAGGACPRCRFAQRMKCFMFERSSWPPSC